MKNYMIAMPPELVERIDAAASRVAAETGYPVSRAAMVRRTLDRAFPAAAAEEVEAPPTPKKKTKAPIEESEDVRKTREALAILKRNSNVAENPYADFGGETGGAR